MTYRIKELLAILILVASCNSIPYQADKAFLSPGQAHANEFPIAVNGQVCKDLDGQVGACLKQLKSDQDAIILMPARPYSYRLEVTCSMDLGSTFPVDVPEDTPYTLTITAEMALPFVSYTCKGHIHPDDREQAVSMRWHVRILIRDVKYQARERIYPNDDRVILGRFAKHSTVWDERGTKHYKEKTAPKVKGLKKAMSESEVGRFNYLGF